MDIVAVLSHPPVGLAAYHESMVSRARAMLVVCLTNAAHMLGILTIAERAKALAMTAAQRITPTGENARTRPEEVSWILLN